jgi:hypothetical protein
MRWFDKIFRVLGLSRKRSGTRQIIDSLIGRTLALIDDELFEEIGFSDRKFGGHVFGSNRGANGVAGPMFDYRVKRDGRVEFRYGDRELRFCWDHLELSGSELVVKCGYHHAGCKSFYRPIKRFAIGERWPNEVTSPGAASSSWLQFKAHGCGTGELFRYGASATV